LAAKTTKLSHISECVEMFQSQSGTT